MAVLGAVLGSKISSDVSQGLSGLGIEGGALNSGTIPNVNTLPGPIKEIVESAYGSGVADIFLIAAPVSVVALVAILFLKEVPLGHKSGVQQQIDDLRAREAVPAQDETVTV